MSIETKLKSLDQDSGAIIQPTKCNLHPNSYDLILSNQGGHDCTLACLSCCNELIDLLKDPYERGVFTQFVKTNHSYDQPYGGGDGVIRLSLLKRLCR